jgi:hypothetical protein
MPLPRPAPPRVLWADLRAVISARGPHRLAAAVLAILIPAAIFTVVFMQDSAYRPEEQTVTVHMWAANRTDAEIIADQKKAQAEVDARAKKRQRQFQKLADTLGIDTSNDRR